MVTYQKKNKEIKKNFFNNNEDYDDYEDAYYRHRSKFIIKIKDYIYPEQEIIKRKRAKTSTVGGSTDSDSNRNLSIVLKEQDHPMSLSNNIKNKNIINNINFEDNNNKNQIIDKESDNQKEVINKNYAKYDFTEIEINNDDGY